jgi:hypothetical protein
MISMVVRPPALARELKGGAGTRKRAIQIREEVPNATPLTDPALTALIIRARGHRQDRTSSRGAGRSFLMCAGSSVKE